ncbi:unnamed protein product [Ostreobium quekettii]|uniref:Uncharacterized protein n=1 Tax=Ostreobium quekettii TaxID=121088 RepID=A0A8S1JBV8_9CHLO|nr:unnamed protein product [Ostreobium quekettii]|eukprot:evm.model.scf_389.1 EVM.evm.TU.scf_389.1   scf_389:9371-9721(-)
MADWGRLVPAFLAAFGAHLYEKCPSKDTVSCRDMVVQVLCPLAEHWVDIGILVSCMGFGLSCTHEPEVDLGREIRHTGGPGICGGQQALPTAVAASEESTMHVFLWWWLCALWRQV